MADKSLNTSDPETKPQGESDISISSLDAMTNLAVKLDEMYLRRARLGDYNTDSSDIREIIKVLQELVAHLVVAHLTKGGL